MGVVAVLLPRVMGTTYLNMGNLLKVLTCTDLEQGPNFFLDFENAQPTEAEKEIWDQVNVVLKDARGILDDLQSYKGAGEAIREAIQHPSDENLQEKAWGAVVPLVGKLKKFYEFSLRLAYCGGEIPTLLVPRQLEPYLHWSSSLSGHLSHWRLLAKDNTMRLLSFGEEHPAAHPTPAPAEKPDTEHVTLALALTSLFCFPGNRVPEDEECHMCPVLWSC
ncbi:protein FAM49B isoform X1 [Arapaima gigas]